MSHVFLSYASTDTVFAELLRMKLREVSAEVWVDQHALRAGEDWRRSIDAGISRADMLVLLVTRASCASPYVTYEWAFALGRGIRVLPVLRDDVLEHLHPRLAVMQYLDFRNDAELPWAALAREVGRLDGKGPEATQSPRVGDLTVDELQALISGAVALAAASANKSGAADEPTQIANAARSVASAVRDAGQRHEGRREPREGKPALWVDDYPNNNVHERAAMESMGLEFTLAVSTAEALDALDRRSFQAIISDMGRREGPQEGYVLLDKLRARGDRTPFFIYSSSNDPEHKREAAARGAQGATNDPRELFELVLAVA